MAGQAAAAAPPPRASGALGALAHGVRLLLLGAAALATVLTVWALARARRCGDAQGVRSRPKRAPPLRLP
jgi:hypothetical protein